MDDTWGTSYLMKPLIDYAHDCLAHEPNISKQAARYRFRDRYAHTLRVMGWCKPFLEEIPANRDVVLACAALHDVGYAVSASDHAHHSGLMALGFLREIGMDESFALNVADLVSRHSDKGLDPRRMSNELIILQDADCLDETGAMSVLWDAMAEGAQDDPTYEKTLRRIAASHAHMSGRNIIMKSDLGNRLYQQRLSFLHGFVVQTAQEMLLDDVIAPPGA